MCDFVKHAGARRLSEMLLKPFDIYGPGTCDQYLSGFMNQVSQAVDDSMTEEVRYIGNIDILFLFANFERETEPINRLEITGPLELFITARRTRLAYIFLSNVY